MKADVTLLWLVIAPIVFFVLFAPLFGFSSQGFMGIFLSAQFDSFNTWTNYIVQVCTEKIAINTGTISIPKDSFYTIMVGNGENMQRFNKDCFNKLCFCMLRPSKLGLYGYSDVKDALDSNGWTEGSQYSFLNVGALQFKLYDSNNYMNDMKEWTDFFVEYLVEPLDLKIWSCRIMHSADLEKGMGCNSCEDYADTSECSLEGNVLFNSVGGEKRYLVLLFGGQQGVYFQNVQLSKKKAEANIDSNTLIVCPCDMSYCPGYTSVECIDSNCICRNEDYTRKILLYPILR